MSNLVRLRVVLAFNRYRKGDIIERIPSVARQMLGQRWYGLKMVELADEAAPKAVVPAEPLAVVGDIPLTENKPGPELAEAGPIRKYKKRGSNP